jgi:hypothetical protein
MSIRTTRDIARHLGEVWQTVATSRPKNEDEELRSLQRIIRLVEEFGQTAYTEAGGSGVLKFSAHSPVGTIEPSQAAEQPQIKGTPNAEWITRSARASTALREQMLAGFLNVGHVNEALLHVTSVETLRRRITAGDFNPQLGWNREVLPALSRVMQPLLEVVEPMMQSAERGSAAPHLQTGNRGLAHERQIVPTRA